MLREIGLVLTLTLGVTAASCSDDTKVVNGDQSKVADGHAGREAGGREGSPSCYEGEKRCATTAFKIVLCKNGQLVDYADCTNKKDAAGNQCYCSVTLGGVCQSGGKICP